MKRNIKKLFCTVMIMIMAVSAVACGSKSSAENLSAEEIYTKMAEASKNIEGMSGKANMDILFSMGNSSTEFEVPITGNMETKTILEPMQAYMKMDYKMSLMGQEQSLVYEVYEVTSDDQKTIETYMNEDGEWTYKAVDLEEDEISEEIKNAITSMNTVDYSKILKYFDKIDAKVSGSNYVINMKVTSSKLIEKIQETEYASYLEDIDMSEIPEIEITAKITVDSKTFLPKNMTLSVGNVQIENVYEGMNISLKKCELTYTYDSYENIEIVVPEEALAAK